MWQQVFHCFMASAAILRRFFRRMSCFLFFTWLGSDFVVVETQEVDEVTECRNKVCSTSRGLCSSCVPFLFQLRSTLQTIRQFEAPRFEPFSFWPGPVFFFRPWLRPFVSLEPLLSPLWFCASCRRAAVFCSFLFGSFLFRCLVTFHVL